MTEIRRRECNESASCEPLVLNPDVRSEDPRRRPAQSAPPFPERFGSDAVHAAAQPKPAAPPPLTREECARLPGDVLDHQARALRSRLGRQVDYPERARDTKELENVEGELAMREGARRAAAQAEHGGVKLCKRTADLPGNSIIGAQHWWLQTSSKSVGMGQADGQVPGHGESGPPNLATKFVDHSQEKATRCDPVAVDEDCVDRELQVGADTGTWIPGINDCHTVVKDIVSKCNREAAEKAAEAEQWRREVDGGAQ